MTQSEALEILKTGQNVFLTGPAGSGKTHLLNSYVQYLQGRRAPVAVTASTGIAATHLNGRTIHSWAGLGLASELNKTELKKVTRSKKVRDRIGHTQTLIIDEISMLDAKRLDLVDQVCRAVRKSPLPFGGIQVVVSGDFFQLPPVSENEDGRPDFAFHAKVWQGSTFTVCYLEQQYRQLDMEYFTILNNIRHSQNINQARAQLQKRLKAEIVGVRKPTKLFSHNIDVDALNQAELSEIKRPEQSYSMQASGTDHIIEALKKSCLAPEVLTLKLGALVMFVTNNFDEGYVNGTLGEIIGFDTNTKHPIVLTKSGLEITARPATWGYEEDGQTVAKINQIPLRLAWAITIHKSQGMSLDCAEIDLSKAFTEGMGYVALSRVRTLDGLTLTGLNSMALRVHKDISQFDVGLREHSKTTSQQLAKRQKETIKKIKTHSQLPSL